MKKIKPTIMERIRYKFEQKTNWLLAPARRKKLNNTDFTIISNNCWGGICYEYFGLPKLSPTVGCWFYADDYLKFISNLKYYLNTELKFIPLNKSKHANELINNGGIFLTEPIGVIEDIEIYFMHYKNELEAKEKWDRRIKRVNYNNLIFKFSQICNCSKEHLIKFDKLDLPGKKICFSKEYGISPSNIYIYMDFQEKKVFKIHLFGEKITIFMNLLIQEELFKKGKSYGSNSLCCYSNI